jgi:hypothetical protein
MQETASREEAVNPCSTSIRVEASGDEVAAVSRILYDMNASKKHGEYIIYIDQLYNKMEFMPIEYEARRNRPGLITTWKTMLLSCARHIGKFVILY